MKKLLTLRLVRICTFELALLVLVWLTLARVQIIEAGGQVTNCANDSEFTQRLGGGGLVTFNCNGTNTPATITLSATKTITQNTTIDGGNIITLSGGGGIYNFSNAVVISSTIRGNSTTTLDGGGFYNGWYANATLNNVTLSGNTKHRMAAD